MSVGELQQCHRRRRRVAAAAVNQIMFVKMRRVFRCRAFPREFFRPAAAVDAGNRIAPARSLPRRWSCGVQAIENEPCRATYCSDE